MINIIVATGVALTCSVAKFDNLPTSASAHLQEEAEIAKVVEPDVGAFLILWNEKACQDLADDQGRLSQKRRDELDAACTKIVHLNKATEKKYVSLSQAYIASGRSDVVTLVWAERDTLSGEIRYKVILANAVDALKIDSPPYGAEGRTDSQCMASPWSFPANDG